MTLTRQPLRIAQWAARRRSAIGNDGAAGRTASGEDRPIVVAGAGAVGCFVGGMLAAAGRSVAMVGRRRVQAEVAACGLRLTSFDGNALHLAPGAIRVSDHASILSDAAIVLVTVKSADTPAMADLIAQHAPEDAVIVSLQNGISNAAALRARLPGRRVLAAMVPFNVIAMARDASTAQHPAISIWRRTTPARPRRSRLRGFRFV